jgi:hypothetical protein
MRRYNSDMRVSTAIAATTLVLTGIASAQPNPDPTDPVYHVEVILFAFNDGNATEEDLHHGQDSDREGPVPRLLTLPDIELESVLDGRAAEPAGNTDGAAEAADTAGSPPKSASSIASPLIRSWGMPAGRRPASTAKERYRSI